MSAVLYEPIYAEGSWNQTHSEWGINYSSILTTLIHMAGSYTDQWASDLFITWRYRILENLNNREWKGDTIYIGFREQGVDDARVGADYNTIEKNQEDYGRCFYRRVVKLIVTINNENISMELSQIK